MSLGSDFDWRCSDCSLSWAGFSGGGRYRTGAFGTTSSSTDSLTASCRACGRPWSTMAATWPRHYALASTCREFSRTHRLSCVPSSDLRSTSSAIAVARHDAEARFQSSGAAHCLSTAASASVAPAKREAQTHYRHASVGRVRISPSNCSSVPAP